MIKLYDSAFSPFARKVRMVLDHKGLSYEAVDGLEVEPRRAQSRQRPHRSAGAGGWRHRCRQFAGHRRISGRTLPGQPGLSAIARRPRARPRLGAQLGHVGRPDLGRHFVLEMGRAAGPDAAGPARSRARRPAAGLRRARQGAGAAGIRQRALVHRRHCAVSAPRQREGDGSRVFVASTPKLDALVQSARGRCRSAPPICGGRAIMSSASRTSMSNGVRFSGAAIGSSGC